MTSFRLVIPITITSAIIFDVAPAHAITQVSTIPQYLASLLVGLMLMWFSVLAAKSLCPGRRLITWVVGLVTFLVLSFIVMMAFGYSMSRHVNEL